MTSSFTDQPTFRSGAEDACAITYRLALADHHALDLFLFYHYPPIRKRVRRVFYGFMLLYGSLFAAFWGLVAGGVVWLLASISPEPFLLSADQVGVRLTLVVFGIWLCGLIPGSLLHRLFRRKIDERFWRYRRTQLRQGVFNYHPRHRLVLTPEGLSETSESHDASASVMITESKVTTVRWTSVTSIDVTDQHAFFTIAEASQSFSQPGFLILPRAAFAREDDFQAFLDMARRHRDAALKKLATPRPALPPHETRIMG
jgi:hypothetical protein